MKRLLAVCLLLTACSAAPAVIETGGPPGTETPSTTGTQPAPAVTTTTVNPADVEMFLVTWQDAQNAQAFEAFQSEQARIDAEAAETARQAEAARAEQDRQQRAAQAEPEPAEPQSAPDPVSQYGSGACGGDLPPCYVMMRESGGDITAQNPTSTASGKWQFIDSTWAGYGGYAKARYAPESVQDEKARQLWAGGAGCGHWSAC